MTVLEALQNRIELPLAAVADTTSRAPRADGYAVHARPTKSNEMCRGWCPGWCPTHLRAATKARETADLSSKRNGAPRRI
jgi:hypothetical protein